MNRTFQIATLFFALAVSFSSAQNSAVEIVNKPIVYDTVHRVILDSVTIRALENSQSFYESAFKDIQSSFSIFLTIIAIIIAITGIYLSKAKKYNEELLGQLKKALNQQEEQRKLLEKFKEEAENTANEKVLELKDELEKQFDTSFRFMSRIYRKSAEEILDKDKEYNFQDYLYYMHIFYRCLIQIKKLNKYDLSRLKRTHEILLNNKNIKKTIKLVNTDNIENKDNIYWYIVHLLKFIKRCSNEVILNDYFNSAKSIYKDLFKLKFSNFNFDDSIIKEELEDRMKKDGSGDEEIKEILELAIKYKGNSSPNYNI